MPHAPNPQLERAADIVLGLVHGIEMMSFNPYDNQISPYGLADWYRYLNLGYQVPLVGGSDKMGQAWLLGGMRTYTHLGDRPFTYENWMAAVKAWTGKEAPENVMREALSRSLEGGGKKGKGGRAKR